MSHKLYSSDFQHPDTGVLIHFVLDEDAELLWLEPCEATCEQRERVESEYQETSVWCKLLGEHTCSSVAEANRLIQSRYSKYLAENGCFPTDWFSNGSVDNWKCASDSTFCLQSLEYSDIIQTYSIRCSSKTSTVTVFQSTRKPQGLLGAFCVVKRQPRPMPVAPKRLCLYVEKINLLR